MKSSLVNVPEVKIKVGHRCLPGIAQGYNILYDRGTESPKLGSQKRNESEKDEPDDTFP